MALRVEDINGPGVVPGEMVLGNPEDGLEITRAKPSEKAVLTRISRACYADDYVLALLDDMLRRGTLLLARRAGAAAGFVYFERALDDSLWLSALRVVPEQRRLGIATALCRAGEPLAEEKEIDAIRLWTAGSNTAAQGVFEGLRYAHVADFTRWWREVGPQPQGSPPSPQVGPDTFDTLERSAILDASHGFLPLDLKFCRYGEIVRERLLASGQVFVTPHGTPLVLNADIWDEFESPTLELTILGDDLRASVVAAERRAADLELEAVGTYLPYGSPWAERAREAGLDLGTWGSHARLYEKRVGVQSPSEAVG